MGKEYIAPWNIHLSSRPWRIEEGGEVFAQAIPPADVTWERANVGTEVPSATTPMPRCVKAPKETEGNILFRYVWEAKCR
jgi:hypothetical protein